VANRGEALEFAVLGLLHEAPMHGYELRKRLSAVLGWGRLLSYGSLYPCLKSMLVDGLIAEDTTEFDAVGQRPRRGKIVYKLTVDGKERFAGLVSAVGPSSWDDDNFGVHFAFFSRADTETRLRILEGRRNRLEERLEGVRSSLSRTRERLDTYTLELQRHGLESVEREVRWLTELIDNERDTPPREAPRPPGRTRRAPQPRTSTSRARSQSAAQAATEETKENR
jgi:DNA-binding PadR family transcriptional regulator